MPFYDEALTLDQLKQMTETHRCNECGGVLLLAWGGFWKIDGYVLRCGNNVEHSTVAPKRTATKGKETYQEKLRREHELEQKLGPQVTKALAHIPNQGQLTQSQAMTILKLQYPGAPENDIVKTAIFCRDFGLHPLANEVYLIPYKGKHVMTVGIPANRKMAHAIKGEFSFLDDTPRAATEEEIIKQYGKDSEEARDNIISVTKLKGEGGNLAIGFGLYSKKESPFGMDKGNTRRNMSNIRSERQAMDRLPGQALPKYDVIDAAYVEIPEVGKVSTSTGEIKEEAKPIIEGEVKLVGDEIPVAEEQQEQETEKPETPAKDESKVSAKEVEDFKALMQKAGKSSMDIGTMMAKDLKWTVPKTFNDLKKWQMTELTKILNKLLG